MRSDIVIEVFRNGDKRTDVKPVLQGMEEQCGYEGIAPLGKKAFGILPLNRERNLVMLDGRRYDLVYPANETRELAIGINTYPFDDQFVGLTIGP